jgi:hypothetical protein
MIFFYARSDGTIARVVVPKGFKIRPSQDNNSHICASLYDNVPICVFLPGGV